jgi:hypothetical protein
MRLQGKVPLEIKAIDLRRRCEMPVVNLEQAPPQATRKQ